MADKFFLEPYVKDGVRYLPTNMMNQCGRCGAQLTLAIVHPVNDPETLGVWNDEGWFVLFRRIGSEQEPPPKFSSTSIGGLPFCSLHLCTRCGDQFKEWLARAD